MLLALTPEYDAPQHEMYVELLKGAVNRNDVLNIALTGRFGAGKSSVLRELARQLPRRILALSLSTLGLPEQGETLTNRIEKELVKQLLHSQPAAALPRSRYQRIQSRRVGWTAVQSVAQIIILGLLLWLLGWLPSLPHWATRHGWFRHALAIALFGLAAATILTWLRRFVDDRVVSSISAGGASISLSDKDVSYFDKYLDEIAYFFETIDVDIVIFEDLDRFGDPYIFDELRELNSLLNSGSFRVYKPIRFIYALADSVFERLGDGPASESGVAPADAAEVESERANRTKFFDYVIPVVPFITHRNSRDLLTQLLSDESLCPVSPALVDLTARHITDMRLLKNIRNEYAVFASRLIIAQKGVRGLKPDELFAMVVYKNIHLSDFEAIQPGRSDLDQLYRLDRSLVQESIQQRRAALRRLARSDRFEWVIRDRTEQWGERLEVVLTRIGSAASGGATAKLQTCVVGSTSFTVAEMTDAAFWRPMIEARSGVVASVLIPSQYVTRQVDLSFVDLSLLIDEELSATDWDRRAAAEQDEERDRLNREIAALRRADFHELAAHDAWTMRQGHTEVTFSTLLDRQLGSELAREMVRAGFIGQNFALHVAQYYGERVSAEAMNFIIQHVQPNVPDYWYSFSSPEDIQSLLEETSASFLDQDVAYNIAVLDYLLGNHDRGADAVLGRLMEQRNDPSTDFLDLYLSEGEFADTAASSFAKRWPGIFTYLMQKAELTANRQLRLVNAALRAAEYSVRYTMSEAVTEFFNDYFAELPCLTEAVPADAADQIVATLASAGFRCSEVALLHENLRRQVVERNMYRITAPNLHAALGTVQSDDLSSRPAADDAGADIQAGNKDMQPLSLDRIMALDVVIFDYCVSDPNKYLDAAHADPLTTWTIEDPTSFVAVLNAIAAWPSDEFMVALQKANPECVLSDLADVPDNLWPALAVAERVTVTLGNVSQYVDKIGSIDEPLAKLLTKAGTIDPQTVGADSEATAMKLSVKLLDARDVLPSAQIRARLVASLDLEDYIDPASIEPEGGSLLALLLDYNLCEDSAALFLRFANSGWDALHAGIVQSKKFRQFMTPELVNVDAVPRLLEATDIETSIKDAVVARMDEFVSSNDAAALRAIGRHAVRSDVDLDIARLTRLASALGDPSIVLPLALRIPQDIPAAQVADVLASLGQKYASLTSPAQKLDLPNDDNHLAVLSRLRAAGLIKFSKRRGKPAVTVTVL